MDAKTIHLGLEYSRLERHKWLQFGSYGYSNGLQ